MPTSKKRIYVQPEDSVLAMVGTTAPALSVALTGWTQLVREATANIELAFSRNEWNYIADTINNVMLESYERVIRPGQWIAVEVIDADKFYKYGEKWNVDAALISERLNGLSSAEGWAVLYAVRWFWDHSDSVDHQKDEWWTLRHREGRS